MRFYPASEVLTATTLLGGFDGATLDTLLALMTPERMVQFLVAKKPAVQLDQKEPWYSDLYFAVQTRAPETLQFYAGGSAAGSAASQVARGRWSMQRSVGA